MLNTILSFLGKGILQDIGSQIKDAYRMRLEAETSEKKLEADQYIAHLQAQQAILLAEQNRLLTSWIRPALALPVVIYIWKIIVFDTVLGLGFTLDPGSFVNWVVVTVVGAYMLTRPFERR